MEKDNTITVEIKSTYGTERIYPLTHTKELENLTGKKTLSKEHIEALKNLGFVIKIKTPEMTF